MRCDRYVAVVGLKGAVRYFFSFFGPADFIVRK